MSSLIAFRGLPKHQWAILCVFNLFGLLF